MSASRPSWRVLVAILQIVAFVVIMVPGMIPGPRHAHAGTPQPGHHHVGSTMGHADAAHAHGDSDARHATRAAGPDRHDAWAGAASQADDADRASGLCCPNCCSCSCHAFAAGPADPSLPLRWTGARAMAPPADSTYATLTPEALPEPPRPFA